MKYIRTKDGRIIDVSNVVLQDGLTVKDIKDISEETGLVACYEGVEIIKYADTIEELCDGYEDYSQNIYSYYDITDYVFSLEDRLKREIHFNKKHNIYYEIKLYIRTDKGLIYVAKMNEKGELELLWQ